MDTRKLSDTVSVSGQIDPADVPDLARAGFRSIVCNRPDGEEDGQPTYADVADAARACGMEVRHIPVGATIPMETQIEPLAAALEKLPAPILAYCRSGARSTALWQAATGSKA